MNPHHKTILSQIKRNATKPTKHTFSDRYLGNTNIRYPINVPTLRKISKQWLNDNTELDLKAFVDLITSLMAGKSSTEKCMGGILLNEAPPHLHQFNSFYLNTWLDNLTGWVEVDTLCSGKYSITAIDVDWLRWKKLLITLSKSHNINKRRASLVLLCSPLIRLNDGRLATLALKNVIQLTSERDILITKAISWVLRSMNKHYQTLLKRFIKEHESTLPKIAVREVLMKIKTGKKVK